MLLQFALNCVSLSATATAVVLCSEDKLAAVRASGLTDASGYPPTLQALVEGVEDARSAKKQRIHFLRRVPRDPFVRDPALPAELTWGLRSHDSPHDAPSVLKAAAGRR